MSEGALGLGMMRLPVKDENTTDIDFEQTIPMVDAFMDADTIALIPAICITRA